MPDKSGRSPQTANRKKIGGDSVVRSCCGTLKGMVLGFECGFVRSTYRANEIQHRNCVDLEITQSLHQASGGRIDFHDALNEFSMLSVRCPFGPISAPTYVKSILPKKENWLRERYNYSMNNDKGTDEDKHETNHINNNKCNDMNTRNMHIT